MLQPRAMRGSKEAQTAARLSSGSGVGSRESSYSVIPWQCNRRVPRPTRHRAGTALSKPSFWQSFCKIGGWRG